LAEINLRHIAQRILLQHVAGSIVILSQAIRLSWESRQTSGLAFLCGLLCAFVIRGANHFLGGKTFPAAFCEMDCRFISDHISVCGNGDIFKTMVNDKKYILK
jgi:hypothetical protein